MVLRRFTTRYKVTYCVFLRSIMYWYVSHNIPSIVQWDPKVSLLLWLERQRSAE